MRIFLYFSLLTCLFISQISHALTVEETLGCYKSINSIDSYEYLIEKDQMKLGDSTKTGKIVPFPGQLIISTRAPDGGPFYKLPNIAESWTKVGDYSLQYVNILPIVGEKEEGLFLQSASFTVDKNSNLVVNYFQQYSSQGSLQESHFGEVLKKIDCTW
jgi:hypothetical protein